MEILYSYCVEFARGEPLWDEVNRGQSCHYWGLMGSLAKGAQIGEA